MPHATNDLDLTSRFGSFPHRVAAFVSAAMLLCGWGSTGAAQAQPRDIGTMTVSGSVLWVRATDAGQVQLFMSRGYRDALARPAVLDAAPLAAWADSARALQRPTTGMAETRCGAPNDADLVLDRWLSSDSAGLRIQQNGTTVVRMDDTSARQLVDLLAEASRVARQLSGPPAAATAQAATTTVVEPTPVSATSVATATVAATPAPPVEDTIPALPVRTPLLQPSIDRTIPSDALTVGTTFAATATPAAPRALDAQPLPPATLADKHIQTPLGPFVVPGAKLADHDAQIAYCYTELGVRYDRRLTGDVTVRVSLSSAGVPDTVEVTKRSWDGVAAAEVESCMRALIEDWSFSSDDASKPTMIELHFTLAPSTGIRAVAVRLPDAAPVAQPR
jgi:hypothetical protein